MTDYVLEAELREDLGKAHTRRLRRAGKLPGIIYGGDKPDLPITLNYNEIAKIMLRDEAFYTSMLEIKVKGKRGKNTVLLKDTQWDSIYDTPMHLDFFRVSGKDSVTVSVPVHPINVDICPGVKAGGALQVIRHELEITCRADAIPDQVEIDCAAFELDQIVHIEDVDFPEGIEVVHDVNFTILSISAPKRAAETETTDEAADETTTESTEGDKEA
ncbi:50S ribosomal protein L25/general stress protein Ctc [Ghiorsea bivora]|uniref:50S ribosomal protein L25/general stress protein Ctc n=1 Tax=Ghiorsea bivora TaxID=1485545 RepID=UPI000570B23D|nr:50S ribosomal protein L25/general stress protein Ctc [Ghiorsea bivora]